MYCNKMPLRILSLMLALLPWAPVVALAPPHPEFSKEDWEELHEMRRLNNFTHDFRPSHIPLWHCQMQTEEQCRQENESARIQKHTGRRLNPNSGANMKVLVLLVIFKDEVNVPILPTVEYFEELFNGRGRSDINPAGSLREYLRYASLGKYNVEFEIRDWFQLPETEKFYAKGVSGRIGNVPMQEMFRPALEAVDEDMDLFDWFDYDTEGIRGPGLGDGVLDHLIVIHSSWGAELGQQGECGANRQPDRIWSQGSAANGGDGIKLEKNNFDVGGYTIASGLAQRVCSISPAPLGIVAHEYLHGFKLPDLYDADLDEDPVAIGGVGNFDIMASPYGWNVNPKFPGHMGPESRRMSGWLDYIELVENGVYAIQPSEMSSQVYVIREGFPEGESLVIELRQQIKWDADFGGSGILIWHIDELAPKQTLRGWPGKPGWPRDHYRVALLQADGLYSLEKGENLGDPGDFWTKGMVLGPSADKWPNTMSYQGGTLRSTGITIEILSKSGFIMNFKVTGITNSFAPAPPEDEMGGLAPSLRGFEGEETGSAIAWLLAMMGSLVTVVGLMVFLL